MDLTVDGLRRRVDSELVGPLLVHAQVLPVEIREQESGSLLSSMMMILLRCYVRATVTVLATIAAGPWARHWAGVSSTGVLAAAVAGALPSSRKFFALCAFLLLVLKSPS